MFCACRDGYGDRIKDSLALGVTQGYWTAYYNNNNKAKVPEKIIKEIYSDSTEQTSSVPDVDVEGFKAVEEEFNRRLRGDFIG